MGFSGGGANITKAHTHSGAISQDGGDLDFNNVTRAGLSAGDLTYSNGTALQVLGIGSATDTLTVNAGASAPEWVSAAGGGGAYSFLQSETLGADTSAWTVTLDSAYDITANGSFVVQLETLQTGGSGGSELNFQFNAFNNDYYIVWMNLAGATQTNGLTNNSGAIPLQVSSFDGAKLNAQLSFFNNPLTASTNYNRLWNFSSYNAIASELRFGSAHREDSTPFTTEITEVTFTLTSGSLAQDSIMNLYVVTNT